MSPLDLAIILVAVVLNLIIFSSTLLFYTLQTHPYLSYRSPLITFLFSAFIIVFINFDLAINLVADDGACVAYWFYTTLVPAFILAKSGRYIRVAFLYRWNRLRLVYAKDQVSDEEESMAIVKTESLDSATPMDMFDAEIKLRRHLLHQNRHRASIAFLSLCIVGLLVFHVSMSFIGWYVLPRTDACPRITSKAYIMFFVFCGVYTTLDLVLIGFMYMSTRDAHGIMREMVIAHVGAMVLLGVAIVFIMLPALQSVRDIVPPDLLTNVPFVYVHLVMVTWPALYAYFHRNAPVNVDSVSWQDFTQLLASVDMDQPRTLQVGKTKMTAWQSFREYAVTDYSIENVLFYEQYNAYLKQAAKLTDTGKNPNRYDQVAHLQRELCDVFIADTGEYQVNLKAATQKTILRAFDHTPQGVMLPVVVLDDAVRECCEMMYTNTFLRWAKTQRK
jgi:hypothetical protein